MSLHFNKLVEKNIANKFKVCRFHGGMWICEIIDYNDMLSGLKLHQSFVNPPTTP